MRAALAAILCASLAGCADSNSEPKFSKESGLAMNCRAYVQVAVDAYRAKQYTAEITMNALERNCGAQGSLWSATSN